jgi:tetratricopeptide (TPR) repeat protein
MAPLPTPISNAVSPAVPLLPSRSYRLVGLAQRYQRQLMANPGDAAALAAISLIALAGRQPEAAVKMATAAVAAAPGMSLAWVALGQALTAARQLGQAGQAYAEALRLGGENPLARLGLGELSIVAGQAEDAIAHFELALARRPDLVPAQLSLGHALAMLSRFQEAFERYQQVLVLRPRLPEAEFACGFVLARLGRVPEAEIRYRRALLARPDFAAAWINLGSLLREQGRDLYAQAALERAVQLRPDLVAGWINLAALARERGRLLEAEAHLQRAFALDPDQVETQIAWCQFELGRKDLDAAGTWLRRALARSPGQPEALNLHGILLHTEGRFAEAVEVFRAAELLDHYPAVSNRGNSLLDMGRMDEALEAHQAAVDLDPTHAGARYNLALTQLRLGHWQRGWPSYEARLRFREVHRHPRRFTQPRWQGEPLDAHEGGRTILLHAEQGLGDTIQFCRFATLVAARGAAVVLEVQPPVARLLQSLGVVRSGRARVVLRGGPLPDFDLECPLMSLPAVFRTAPETVPWPGAYLAADAEVVRESLTAGDCSRLAHHAAGSSLRVGIAWAGNPGYKADHQRSVELKTMLPLLETAGVQWISLQKGEAAGQMGEIGKKIPIADASSGDRDLADTAALIATLDLVITTDTCIAHLAGAMAKPVWILLPHLADWRWMQEVEATPWYPTARLLRQGRPGDWPSVMARARADLTGLAHGSRRASISLPPSKGPPRHSQDLRAPAA